MNNSTIIALFTIGAGVIIFILKICFASKCDKIKVCYGIIDIEREVTLESKLYRQTSNEIPLEIISKKLEETKL